MAPLSLLGIDRRPPRSKPARPRQRWQLNFAMVWRQRQHWQKWLQGALVLSVMGSFLARGDGKEVVVLYVKNSPESKNVADHYAARREVPAHQLIGVNVSVGDNLSRADYERLVQLPLISELQERGLCRFVTSTVPATNDIPSHLRYRCVEAKVRYLVLTWGFPYRVLNDPNFKEDGAQKLPPEVQRNEAALDSDLALLPSKGYFPIFGPFPNYTYATTNLSLINPTNGVFAVTRLDGPTPEIAKALVDKAMAAETNGLCGHAYFDERGIKDGAYATGDRWMTNAALIARLAGFSTYVDHQPETIPVGFPMSQVALYAGWYEVNPSGPFATGSVEFVPGAIAYHLHSFSALNLRSPSQYWVGPLLQMGATATMGCVAEPYLDLTPEPHRLLERMIFGQFTFGEASLACQSHLSWQNVFVGDPLYRPFGRRLDALEAELERRHDPHLDWVILRKVNTYLVNEKPRGPLLKDLVNYPLSTNSSILAERIGMLQADEINLSLAIEWAQRALNLQPTPNQRLRLLLNIAQWQATLDRPNDAFASLREIEALRSDYRGSISFRQKQLNLAREAKLNLEVDRLLGEISRLKSALAPTDADPKK